MQAGLVSVIIVNFKTERYLRECLESVRAQDYRAVELILINNASPGFDRAVIDEFRPCLFIGNSDNTGFARANNQGILRCNGEFVLLLNADARIPPDFISRAVAHFARDKRIGTVVPRLVRWGNTSSVESTGHIMRTDFTPAHRDHDARAEDAAGDAGYVFGGTAACAIYRREMLEDVRFENEYLDESFYAYFEDVDLDLRAQLLGWRAWHEPTLVAEHVGGGSGMRRSARMRLIAEKNRYLCLAKCLTAADWLPCLPALTAYEGWHFLNVLARPYLLLAMFAYLYYLPEMMLKRIDLMRRRKLKPRELRAMLQPRFGAQRAVASKRIDREYPLAASVVVLNYNGIDETRRCLDALALQEFADYDTIIVDNGSDNDEAAALRHEYPHAHVVSAKRNHGFAGGVNLGARLARGKYLVLLNNDAEPEPQFLGELTGAMEQTGADAGCGVLLEDGRDETNDTISVLGYTIPRVFGDDALTFYPSGGAAIIRRDSLIAIGGEVFDPAYFIYHEDVSLGFRIRLAGGEVIKIPSARARHLGSVTTRKLPSATVLYYQARNRVLNRLIYLQAGTQWKLAPLCLAECVARHAIALGSWPKLSAVLRTDGFILAHAGSIIARRIRAGKLRHLHPLAMIAGAPVRDADFMPLLSGRINGLGGFADKAALWWLRLVGLPVSELKRDKF